MGSPVKPFACTAADCGMTFTNEDHLTVHVKKHDMALQLGLGQKTNIFPADQTPTPTRFIRNCEEVGLFQDLQNVNPFDEGFKRAMETKNGMLISLDNAIAASTSDDALHTPHIFPSLSDVTETGLYNSTTKQTITRSSSDESNTIKHYETSTIETKLVNEVTVGKNEHKETSNTITIQSNIEIRKSDFSTIVASNDPNLIKLVVANNDRDLNVVRKDVMLADTAKVPVMSQQSLDFAIDSLTSHVECAKVVEKETPKNQILIDTMRRNIKNALNKSQSTQDTTEQSVGRRGKKRSSDLSDIGTENYEVMIKLPSGELLHMKSSDKKKDDPKQRLKDAIEKKIKTEIENEIRTNIENQIKSEIQSGNFILKVRDPDAINSAAPSIITETFFVTPKTIQLEPKPVSVVSGVLLPVKKIAIPPFKFPIRKEKPATVRKRRAKMKTLVEHKTVQHKPDCDILQKVGGQCNLRCGQSNAPALNIAEADIKETDRNETVEHEPVTTELVLGTPIIVENITEITSVNPNIVMPNLQGCSESKCKHKDAVFLGEAVRVTDQNSKAECLDVELVERNQIDSSLTDGQIGNIHNYKKESNAQAVKRYRSKQKQYYAGLTRQNRELRNEIERLDSLLCKYKIEVSTLKHIFVEHLATCANAEDIRLKYEEILKP